MILDQIKQAIAILNPDEFQELKKWIDKYDPNRSADTDSTQTILGKVFVDDSSDRRNQIINEIKTAADFMVITVQKLDSVGKQPITMHTSRQNKIGPALLTLICQDYDFCEALGEMVNEARRRRLGYTPTELFP